MKLPWSARRVAAPRFAGDESDVIVALIRTAFIIAFAVIPGLLDGAPVRLPLMEVMLVIAAVFNLAIFICYFAGLRLHWERPFALAIDLLLVTGAILGLRNVGQDIFELYYLVVITAAIWYRRSGAVIIALAAAGLYVVAPAVLFGEPVVWQLFLFDAKAPLLLLIAVITGYLVRARDLESRINAELNQEMRLAHDLQTRMLPAAPPVIEGYEIGCVFHPARMVGGDFYDLRLLQGDTLFVGLADMAGKSFYGMLHMSLVHSHLQSALAQDREPSKTAERVNRKTYAALQPDNYAAVFLGFLHMPTGRLQYANCGHLPPGIICAETGEWTSLHTGDIVLGVINNPGYKQAEHVLNPGDILVCFSDGVTDFRNKKGEEFSEQGVFDLCREYRDLPAQELAERLYAAAEAFGTLGNRDDSTVIVIRRIAEDPTARTAKESADVPRTEEPAEVDANSGETAQ